MSSLSSSDSMPRVMKMWPAGRAKALGTAISTMWNVNGYLSKPVFWAIS